MFDRQLFKDTNYDTTIINFKEYKTFSIYDTLNEKMLDYILQNLGNIKYQAIEVCFDARNQGMLDKVVAAGFEPNYHWYIYDVAKEDCNKVSSTDIGIVKKRKLVKDMLTDQVHELAQRMPEMFDENGEEKGWYKCGKKCIVYLKDNQIASILTYTHEKHNNNIHIFLTYTLPQYRSMGLGSKLIDYVKHVAAKNNIATITVCTDVSEGNRVPNMFYKNGFRYFKTGYWLTLNIK